MELERVKGIGPKTKQILNHIGIFQVEDFVTYYPYRYERIMRSELSLLNQDDKIIMDGVVETVPVVSFFGRRKNRMQFYLSTDHAKLQVVIFNRAYLKQKLTTLTEVTVIGKYDKKNSRIIASELRFGRILKPTIERVYHLTDGISKKALNQYIDLALQTDYQVEDLIPPYFKEKYHFWDKKKSIEEIHHPHSKEALSHARARIIYEELFCYMLKVNEMRKKKKKTNGIARQIDEEKIESFEQKLPFVLTSDQKKSIDDILSDLKSPNQMNRLLQGDVGSGKTIVAIIAIYANYLSGYQSAFMAPTEILATQHYQALCSLFQDIPVHIALLTGKMKKKERANILGGLVTGDIDIIIGTHALVSEDVSYQKLGLVITDEQHRFGVRARTTLTSKGFAPDILSMSATPIPRTYALTLYGDMDISNIKTMPTGRKSVITTIASEKEIRKVLEKMYEELCQGHQIYVVAPLIEDEEEDNDVSKLYENMNKAFGKKFKIDVMHGRMKTQEKEDVMQKFTDNKIQILISTTVIEVGVDVANATMIVIFNAERFGLATLHQLRGRVGRSDIQSYCILVSDKSTDRLKILTDTNDGFVISEEDFKMRGSGDIFGERQSGEILFKVADLKRDFKILQIANEDSKMYLKDKQFINDEEIKRKSKILDVMNLKG